MRGKQVFASYSPLPRASVLQKVMAIDKVRDNLMILAQEMEGLLETCSEKKVFTFIG